ncbi:MAG: hypothetical protein O7G84_13570 [Gammaproteobacteria bacterium]|nr:hypothetical protein [Gammaproteobacteria bacterium]
MPIKKSQRARYPADWDAISRRIRFERAESKCECTGQCGDTHHGAGRCNAPHGRHVLRHREEPWRWITSDELDQHRANGIRPDEWAYEATHIVLTAAHIDQTPENCADENLLAMCQRCHNKLDQPHRQRNARETRRGRKAIGELPGLGDDQ